ncbi:MAG: 50S ribosomal protein L25 [Solirubrobacterales bacterium]
MINRETTLGCEKRELKTAGYLKKLRKQGQVPAVIYSKGQEAVALTVDGKSLARLFQHRGGRGLFTLQIHGEPKVTMALIRELQIEPTTGAYVHLDLQRIDMSLLMRASIPVVLSGDDEIETKTGGMVQVGLKEIEVECLPGILPENFQLNVSKGKIGTKYRAHDLPLPDGIVLITEPDGLLAVILPSKAEKETAAQE